MTVIIRNREQLAQAEHDLEILRRAREKILVGGQAYTMGPGRMERADLKEISEQISMYEAAIDSYRRTGTSKRRGKRVVPTG